MVMAKGGHKMKYDSVRISMDNGLTQMRISDEALSDFEKIHCDLELGDAVLFLCSDEASFITAQDLIIDGGATSGRWGEVLQKANSDIKMAISGEHPDA